MVLDNEGSGWMVTRALRLVVLTLLASAMLPGGAWGGETWICAVTSAVAIDEDGTVGPPDLGDKERPTFIRVDPEKKELTLLAPKSRKGEVTKLDTVKETDGLWVLSGSDQSHGVTVIINAEGHLTISVIGDGVVWSVFGHALPEHEKE